MNRRTDVGSVLMLVPAGILVLFILGAIAVDSAVVFLAERDLSNRTAAVANDVAGFAASDDAFYRNGQVELAQPAARAYIAAAFAPSRLPAGYDTWQGAVRFVGPRTVEVSATAEVRRIFGRSIPGVSPTVTVDARSTATAQG